MDSMEIDDDMYIHRNLTMEGLICKVDFQRPKQPSRCATVCLGLLCAVLLAGNIGQLIYYEIISRPASADPTQANYSALTQAQSSTLTAERKQLEARLSNLTKDEDQLRQSYSSLTTERDELKANYNNLKSERDRFEASYNTVKQESNQLRTSYNDMQRNLQGLQTNHNNLTASKDQLKTDYNNLQREKDELHTLFITLTANRDQLQRNYSLLKRDKDQLQRDYITMSMSKNFLQTSYNSLWKDKEQLQTTYTALQREKEQLQKDYSSLATSRDQLEKKINKVRGRPCPTGWKRFDISCYFVSNMKKNWTLGRQDCIAKGADLVTIDSRDEQAFLNGLLESGQNAWIGLSDSLKEGTWMWVDGTPVTAAFWQPGQPNSFQGNQDCGEMVPKSPGVGEWNDDGCFAEQIWICEK
ncbi:C-type lectin domain family 4 member M-like [Enoplosus armatus]|uniref:C-type lectin domain family 4 member M-like n=1 Tax=Enoplosus armatus TaxID=215367 RepID=UPI00399580CF